MAMPIAQSLLSEFEVQAAITRKFLERLPEDKLTWKPHEKSRTAGQLALHLASVPGGVVRFVQNNPAESPGFSSGPQPASRAEILKTLEDSIAGVRSFLSKCFLLSHAYNSFATSCLITGTNIGASSASICGCSMFQCRQAGDRAPTRLRRLWRKRRRHSDRSAKDSSGLKKLTCRAS